MLSGVNSPAAISSPSCEIKNELIFPSLPTIQSQPAFQPAQQQTIPQQEQTKVAPKICQLTQLDQQLSKLHNQRTVLPQQPVTQHAQTFSEAVRQSPTTVQPPPPAAVLNQPTALQQNAQQQQVNNASPQTPSTMARRPSRFMVSKVIEEAPKTQQPPQIIQNIQTHNVLNPTPINLIQQHQQQSQTIPKSTISSPDTDQQMQQRNQQQVVQPQQDQIVTSQQAQNYFNQGGSVVSSLLCMSLRLLYHLVFVLRVFGFLFIAFEKTSTSSLYFLSMRKFFKAIPDLFMSFSLSSLYFLFAFFC